MTRRPTLLQVLVFALGAALAVLSFDGLTAAALASDAVHHQWLAYVWAGSVDLLWISAVVAIRRSAGGRRVAAVAVLLVGLSASLMQVWVPPTWAARLVPPVGLLLAVLLEVYVVRDDRPRTAQAEQDRNEDRREDRSSGTGPEHAEHGRNTGGTTPALHTAQTEHALLIGRTAEDRPRTAQAEQGPPAGPPDRPEPTDDDTWPDPEDPQMTAKDRAAELLRTAPDLPVAELADRLQISARYARKLRQELTTRSNGHGPAPAGTTRTSR